MIEGKAVGVKISIARAQVESIQDTDVNVGALRNKILIWRDGDGTNTEEERQC